ncbi:MAG: 3-oxocholest-4-en-26-oate---CoA ligase [Actinomycetota bacterium]|nr:3-oxocholest-4-en-26-oate---CoA ligase [Actinomycetota bacterium]
MVPTEGQNLADRFLAAAAGAGDRTAIVVAGDDARALTYDELTARAERLASVLHARGIRAGDRVGVLLANGNEHLEVLLASFLLRAVPVNLSYRDTPSDVHAVLDATRVSMVVHEPDLDPQHRVALARGEAYEAALDGASPAPSVADRSGDDRYLLCTGGTTGRPKAVLWRHDDLYRGALAPAGGEVGVDDTRATRCLPASPFAHGTGQWMALATLLHRGTVVCRRDRSFDPEAVLDTVDAESVSYLVVVGDAFARPLLDVLDACPGRWSLASLTTVLSGGAPLSSTLTADLLRQVPTAIVVDGFGASETGGHGRMVTVAGTPADERPPRFHVDADTAVLGDDLRPLHAGDRSTGFLARRGTVPIGYENDPEATAATFPIIDGVRWALSGDRARVEADGSVTVLGRGAATINTGGHKVQAEEVEQALRTHPAVRDVVVIGVPDDRFGERVAAIVSARHDAHPTLESVRRHCRARLAPYKVPRHLVVVDEVARSLAGKPDYAWARQIASS